MSEFFSRGDMGPLPLPFYTEAAFVIANNLTLSKMAFTLLLETGQIGVKLILIGTSSRFIQPVTNQILHQLTDTLITYIFMVGQKAR
jgi:hypothetical protein